MIAIRAHAVQLRGGGATDTVLISRKAFTEVDVAAIRKVSAESHLDAIYVPGQGADNPFGQLLTAADPQAFFSAYPYNVAPVSDDQPFFFDTVSAACVVRRGGDQSGRHDAGAAAAALAAGR